MYCRCLYSSGRITGKLRASPVNSDNVKMLAEAARKYQMAELLDCCDYFCTRGVDLNTKNVSGWLEFAYQYELEEFSKRCEAYVNRENIVEIIENLGGVDQLKSFPPSVAAKLLMCAANRQADPNPKSMLHRSKSMLHTSKLVRFAIQTDETTALLQHWFFKGCVSGQNLLVGSIVLSLQWKYGMGGRYVTSRPLIIAQQFCKQVADGGIVVYVCACMAQLVRLVICTAAANTDVH